MTSVIMSAVLFVLILKYSSQFEMVRSPSRRMVCRHSEPEKRRSRLFRLEAAITALEATPNATRIVELTPQLARLIDKETFGKPAQAKVAELQARLAALKEKTKKKRLKIGQVVTGACVEIKPFGAMIDIGRARPALLHISEISNARIDSVPAVIPVGSDVTCVVVNIDDKGRVSVSTRKLESKPGEIMRDKDAVFANATKKMQRANSRRDAARRKEAAAVTTSVADMANLVSLDELDGIVARAKNRKVRRKYEVSKKDEAQGEDALAILSAFQRRPDSVKSGGMLPGAFTNAATNPIEQLKTFLVSKNEEFWGKRIPKQKPKTYEELRKQTEEVKRMMIAANMTAAPAGSN